MNQETAYGLEVQVRNLSWKTSFLLDILAPTLKAENPSLFEEHQVHPQNYVTYAL